MEPCEAVDICFLKPKSKNVSQCEARVANHNLETRRRPFISSDKPKIDSAILLNNLYRCYPDSALFSVIPGLCSKTMDDTTNITEPNLPKPLNEYYDVKYCQMPSSELEKHANELFAKLKITQNESSFLEISTRKQASCCLWFQYREGLITASHFHEIIRYTGKKFPKSILSKLMQYNTPSPSIPALKWGRDHEEEAKKAYLRHMKDHGNFHLKPSGLIINASYPFLGASPDGTTSCICCGDGLSEIKCTYKYRFELPTCDAALSDQNYFLKEFKWRDTSFNISCLL